LLVAIFLFAQIATAAHACVSLARSTGSMPAAQDLTAQSAPPRSTAPVAASMDDVGRSHCRVALCDVADSSLGPMCDAHCQSDQQRVDISATVAVPAALLSSIYPLPVPDSTPVQRGLALALTGPPDAADPPHTILHCCFRL